MATISFDYKTFLQCTASTSKAKGTSTSKSDLQLSMQPNIKNLPFTKVGCTVMTEIRTISFIVISNKCFEAYQIKKLVTGLSKA